jgi:hypothetical protein
VAIQLRLVNAGREEVAVHADAALSGLAVPSSTSGGPRFAVEAEGAGALVIAAPASGPQVPPWYLAQARHELAPGAAQDHTWRACFLPAGAPALAGLASRGAAVEARSSALVLGASCRSLAAAGRRARGGDALRARQVVLFPGPGRYALSFRYEETASPGFEPEHVLRARAAPVALEVSAD